METNKTIIWSVVAVSVVAVLAIAGYMLFMQNPQVPVNTTQNESPVTQTYTMSDVEKHNSASDCWMAIDGKVYNVTSFVNNHPGGPAILKGCGKDATVLFNERPDSEFGPHPEQAIALLTTLYIGDLK